MPIVVRAVSPDKFAAWATQAATDLPGAYKLLAAQNGNVGGDASVEVAAAVK